MIEKVNPQHPDKVADRIAGAIVDLIYKDFWGFKDWRICPRIAVEVLIGHGTCHVIIETSSTELTKEMIVPVIHRIAGDSIMPDIYITMQDVHLAENQQQSKVRCGDNGIFKGVPTNKEEKVLSEIAHKTYDRFLTDGKYILSEQDNQLIICQSCAKEYSILHLLMGYHYDMTINPIGYWTGGTDVDTGATNRKLGSDMGRAVTGGGLHGKDMTKADVSVNVYAFLKAQKTKQDVELYCAIGDEEVDGLPYEEIIDISYAYIKSIGGFEALAMWGLF